MNTVLLYILLSLPMGFMAYYSLVRNIRAHITDFKGYLAFFVNPHGPSKMLILHKLGGEFSIYYDDQIKEIKGEKQSEVLCKNDEEFDHFIVHNNLSDYSIKVSMYDARGPKGYDSPFSLTWRWILGASILIYLNYLAMIEGWIPPEGKKVDTFWAMLGTMAFFIALTWYLINIVRLKDETIEYIYLLPKGTQSTLVEYIHAPEPLSNLSLPKFLKEMGKEIRIEIPKEVKDIFDRLKKDKRDAFVTALSLTKFFESYAWKKALAENLSEMIKLRKTGETVAMIKMSFLTQRSMAIIVIAFVIGVVIGFALGNIFGFGFGPATNNTTTTSVVYVPIKPATPPVPPGYGNNTTIVPAIPPTPPIGG